jgi:hypothetical protein
MLFLFLVVLETEFVHDPRLIEKSRVHGYHLLYDLSISLCLDKLDYAIYPEQNLY